MDEISAINEIISKQETGSSNIFSLKTAEELAVGDPIPFDQVKVDEHYVNKTGRIVKVIKKDDLKHVITAKSIDTGNKVELRSSYPEKDPLYAYVGEIKPRVSQSQGSKKGKRRGGESKCAYLDSLLEKGMMIDEVVEEAMKKFPVADAQEKDKLRRLVYTRRSHVNRKAKGLK